MKVTRVYSLVLAAFLQLTPITVRCVQPGLACGASASALILQWMTGAFAVAGTFHGVSGASVGLTSPRTIQGTAGATLSYQIKITGPRVRAPQSWLIAGQTFSNHGSTVTGFPPGLSMALTTGIIRGVPTQSGTFSVDMTAFEYPNLQGPSVSFSLSFVIAGGTVAPTLTTQPSNETVQVGQSLALTVVATGTSPFTYQWQHNGSILSGQTAATLTIPAVGSTDAGIYSVTVTGLGGSATSNAATVTITPLTIQGIRFNIEGVTLWLQTLPGRNYVIEAAPTLNGSTWQEVATVTATGSVTTFVDPTKTTGQRFWRYSISP